MTGAGGVRCLVRRDRGYSRPLRSGVGVARSSPCPAPPPAPPSSVAPLLPLAAQCRLGRSAHARPFPESRRAAGCPWPCGCCAARLLPPVGCGGALPRPGSRDVLTSPLYWQYAVLLNKFSYFPELENNLHLKGYYSIFQENLTYAPGSLKCYISRTPGRFPAQKHQTGKLKEYYLLNAASLLSVLALEIKDGERVLDMCAAPGGKSIAMLQCAWPGHLHCNEYDSQRSRRLKQTLESFIPEPLMNSIALSELDGRQIGDLHPELYDKVLLDSPCSNDRSWLFSSDIQQATLRLIQRKELPAVQVELLRSAIKALRPGGSVVYSTCTLSKAENSDVISHILNSCSNILPEDISELADAVSDEFTVVAGVQPHELLVLPTKEKAWGPMYLAKLKKM